MFQIRKNDNTNHNIIEETRAKKERHFIKNERIQKMIPILNRYSLLFHVLLACGVCLMLKDPAILNLVGLIVGGGILVAAVISGKKKEGQLQC